MNNSLLFTLAMIVLALAGLAALLAWWQHVRQNEQLAETLDRALRQAPRPTPAGTPRAPRSAWEQLLDAVERMGRRFESGRLGQALITAEDRLLLDRTNRNSPAGRAMYLGLRLALALALPLLLLPWLVGSGDHFVLGFLVALAAGMLLPKLVLSSWAARLRKQVFDELPLLVDLLRLLQGMGLSIDQSLQTIEERFANVMPALSRELQDANRAYRHGRPRGQSLRRLSDSFDNPELHGLVQIITQVHEHGGAVQEPLRQFADRLREQRKLVMKERTGKLSVKMTLVMMLTLLPALMMVLAGPAVVSMIGTISQLKGP